MVRGHLNMKRIAPVQFDRRLTSGRYLHLASLSPRHLEAARAYCAFADLKRFAVDLA